MLYERHFEKKIHFSRLQETDLAKNLTTLKLVSYTIAMEYLHILNPLL